MPAILHAQFLILVLGVLLLPAVLVYCDFPATLILEKRAGSGNQSLELSEVRARDKVRHGRILQGGSIGVVDFPVQGSSDPYTIGLYFTRVKLGSPPKEYYVQIDTGSDILWVNCNSCTGCPTTSELGIELEFFDPSSSSSATPVSCSDSICEAVAQSYDSSCSANSQCSYSFQYGDGSGTSGYYVSDMFSFDTVIGDSSTANSSANIVFGCSNYQSGGLTKPDRAVDGILGFGQHGMSVISQLASRGITPKVFSHCLKGEDKGGGILVLGEIVEPGIVYSPLVPSQPHYNLNLLSISINGQTVPIDPEVFATSINRGTIVDSGTTLAYLAEEAYDPFVISLAAAVPPSVSTFSYKGNKCFLVSSRDVFPVVSLNFAGAASMVLKPEEYLIQQLDAGPGAWCIGFLKTPGQGVTILGDLVLKDKIIVYDLARQRLGWADYDCSSSVNVSLASTGKDEYINAGQLSVSSSSQDALYQLMPIAAGAFIVYISSIMSAGFLYL